MRFYNYAIALFILFCGVNELNAQAGDTTIVQTFTWAAQNNPATAYDSPGRRWFQFPASNNGIEYQKILMYYNLKCFEDGTAGGLDFPCGEWDYLTYTYLYQHTGEMDSTLVSHPVYMVNNANFNTAPLTSQAISNTRQLQRFNTTIDEVISEDTITLGWPSSLEVGSPFSQEYSKRSVLLYRADELLSAGLVPGISPGRIAFYFSEETFNHEFFKVEIAYTDDTLINGFYDNLEFLPIHDNAVSLTASDWLYFTPGDSLIWDGNSSLLIRLSHDNTDAMSPSSFIGMDAGFPSVHSSEGDDRYISLDWQDEVKVPKEVFENVSETISISFWSFGDPDVQPQDGTIFEGVNSQNQRVLNAHLPWSNGNVYWDAGYDGGYDRINKLAVASNYEGKWNHWCFTKDATTGTMKIFLNGTQWHQGSNLDNLMLDVQRFSIGGATSWSNFYNGSIDEFAVFNVVLDATTISEWMNRDLNSTHPNWSSLQVYYQFNENDGEMVIDASGNARHAWIHGNAARVRYRSEDLWRNGVTSQLRPALRLYFGEYESHVDTSTISVIEAIPPVSIVQYDDLDYYPYVVNVDYAWESQYTYTFGVEGDTLDSLFIPSEYILNNEEFTYYQQAFEVINRFELNRFITMYGINLTLGDDGWTWVVDVTDWEPLLRDSVELESGNWQELLDLKFVFIEGPAPRDVKRVMRVWDTDVALSNFDNVVGEKIIEKLPGEYMWKLITTNTGHQFDNPTGCGEFCNNMQTVSVNNQEFWTWDIMQECSLNPLFPQGGTWIYDRAGWCPGMNSTTKEFELTPYVGEMDNFSVDYDITSDPYGNYVFFGTLIGYGEPNLQHDPEIDMITAPSDWKIHGKWNPVCNSARFILRNKGALPLTDLNIIYGILGGEVQSYHWTGNLGFMEKEEVELACYDQNMWLGDDDELLTFFIQLGYSADGLDENNSNNYGTNRFVRPPHYQYSGLDDNRLVIMLKTNLAYTETSYTLFDANGNVVFERNDFDAPNTTYSDTLELNTGCYVFHLKDTDDDGIGFFNNDDEYGYCKLDRVQGLDFIYFERDFGREIKHHFVWNTDLVSVSEETVVKHSVRVYPNPAGESIKVEARGFDRKMTLTVYDSRGMMILTEGFLRRSALDVLNLNTGHLPAGMYTLRLTDDINSSIVKFIKN